MTSSISGVNQLHRMLLSAGDPAAAGGEAPAGKTVDFQSMLVDLLQNTSAADAQAQQAIGEYQVGGGISKPEVFVEMRKAELALRMTMQIRNKLVDAYDELQQMRM